VRWGTGDHDRAQRFTAGGGYGGTSSKRVATCDKEISAEVTPPDGGVMSKSEDQSAALFSGSATLGAIGA
jgi:hypothetical protein